MSVSLDCHSRPIVSACVLRSSDHGQGQGHGHDYSIVVIVCDGSFHVSVGCVGDSAPDSGISP